LYVFSRFFTVSSQEEADIYAAEFEENDLARELIRMYNTSVANLQNLVDIENRPYFVQRLNEAQLAEARAEARAEALAEAEAKTQRLNEAQLAETRAEARAEAEAKGIAIGESKGAKQLAKLIRDGYDVNTALKMMEKDE
jgi:flagellar biosynthesis/type III secretory pathway protein FliH